MELKSLERRETGLISTVWPLAFADSHTLENVSTPGDQTRDESRHAENEPSKGMGDIRSDGDAARKKQ